MSTPTLIIGDRPLTLADFQSFVLHGADFALDPAAMRAVDRSHDVIQDILAQGKIAYGINTGFGALAKTHIDAGQLAELQRRLVLSHAVGVGPLLDDATVRLVLLLKIVGLARGFSGVRPVVIERLAAFLKAGLYPCIPSKGSVGASGDLAPNSFLLIGGWYTDDLVRTEDGWRIEKRIGTAVWYDGNPDVLGMGNFPMGAQPRGDGHNSPAWLAG